MKKIVKIVSIILIISFTFSCKKFLDVNHDPNAIENSTVEMVLPSAIVSTCYVVGGTWHLLGSMWSQQWTSGPNAPQYQTEDNFNIKSSDYGRNWSSLYSGALMDLEYIKKEAYKNKNWNYFLIATLLQCYNFQILADFYDEIPCSEALQIKTPIFDKGQVVYDTLIARIDFALAQDLNAKTSIKPTKDDLIFQGDMIKWVQFANTLKLKIYLHQVYARPEIAQAGIAKLEADGANYLTVDASMKEFTDLEAHDNPIYGTEWRVHGNINMVASRTIMDFLTGSFKDPRAEFLFTKVGTTYKAMYQGDYRTQDPALKKAEFSTPKMTATTPVFLFTASQVHFMRAEAILRGYAVGNPKTYYELGIRTDYSYLGVADAANATIPAYTSAGTMEDKLEDIMVQKWVASVNKTPIEAFFDHNRTGYPKELNLKFSDPAYKEGGYDGKGYFIVSETSVLTPPVLYPKRLLFPDSETNSNPNTPKVKLVNEKIWWDVK